MLILLLALTSAPAPVKTCCEHATCKLCQEETALLKQVNALRVRHGLWPLKRDHLLITSCRRHSLRQALSRRLFHRLEWPATAECIAQGQSSVPQVVADWYHSSGHRKILLSRSRWMGASRNGAYWTLRTR